MERKSVTICNFDEGDCVSGQLWEITLAGSPITALLLNIEYDHDFCTAIARVQMNTIIMLLQSHDINSTLIIFKKNNRTFF